MLYIQHDKYKNSTTKLIILMKNKIVIILKAADKKCKNRKMSILKIKPDNYIIILLKITLLFYFIKPRT